MSSPLIKQIKTQALEITTRHPERSHARTLHQLSQHLGVRGGWNALLACTPPLRDQLQNLDLPEEEIAQVREALRPHLTRQHTQTLNTLPEELPQQATRAVFLGFNTFPEQADELSAALLLHPQGQCVLIMGNIGCGKSRGVVRMNLALNLLLGVPISVLTTGRQEDIHQRYDIEEHHNLEIISFVYPENPRERFKEILKQPSRMIIIDELPNLCADLIAVKESIATKGHTVILTMQNLDQYRIVTGDQSLAQLNQHFELQMYYPNSYPSKKGKFQEPLLNKLIDTVVEWPKWANILPDLLLNRIITNSGEEVTVTYQLPSHIQ